MQIVRQPLPGDTQADYNAATGVLTIDNRVPRHGIQPIIAQAYAHLMGLPAPYVRDPVRRTRRRDHLTAVPDRRRDEAS